MKGWVYVITNRAMPGLVKVGYSSKDPELRAAELNHTGAPYPYLVEYEALVEEPFSIEQRTHRSLSHLHEGERYQKGVGVEWFNCSVEEAISAIKINAGAKFIMDSYKGADRKKAEELYRQKKILEEELHHQKKIREAAEVAKKELAQKIHTEEREIVQAYQQMLESRFPPEPFYVYWLSGAALCFFVIMMLLPKAKDSDVFWLCAIGGAFAAVFLRSYFEDKKKKSFKYRAIEIRRDEELASVRLQTVPTATSGAALQLTNALSDKENPEVQGKLGVVRDNGDVVAPPDYEGRMKRFRLSAEQGDATAQFNLGSMYEKGEGVPQDYEEAERWLLRSAEQGNSKAKFMLGKMHYYGQGVQKNGKEAVKWFRLAADQGNHHAQNILGLMYKKGEGLPQDYKEAEKWFRLAAYQGFATAQLSLGCMYYNGEGVPQDYEEAAKWLLRSAEQGDATAQSSLGVMYRHGQGVQKNDKEAVKWYRLAADQGIAQAQEALKIRY